MMRIRWFTVLAATLAMAVPAVAQGPDSKGKPAVEKAKGKDQAGQQEKEKAKAKDKGKQTEREEESERLGRELRGYYEKSGAKPEGLPPGIAKNLQRGKPLPPGIQRSRVPDDLLPKLPKRPGEEWAMFGNRLVAIDKAGVVKEIITP